MRSREFLEALSIRAQTETPEFKRWFGASKVVDAEGQLLIVYHGTTKDFEAFKLPGRKARGGNAIFFATAPSTASYFSRNMANARVLPVYVRLENPFDFASEAALALIEPFIRKNFAALYPGALFGPDAAISFLRGGDYGSLEKPAVRAWMVKRGYDGFWTNEQAGGQRTLGVFSPNQVKSAIGNQGQFNPADDRINEAP